VVKGKAAGTAAGDRADLGEPAFPFAGWSEPPQPGHSRIAVPAVEPLGENRCTNRLDHVPRNILTLLAATRTLSGDSPGFH